MVIEGPIDGESFRLYVKEVFLPTLRRARAGGGLRTLSALNLEKQIGSHDTTGPDRELIACDRMPITDGGFGERSTK